MTMLSVPFFRMISPFYTLRKSLQNFFRSGTGFSTLNCVIGPLILKAMPPYDRMQKILVISGKLQLDSSMDLLGGCVMIQTAFIEIAYHAWYSEWFFPEVEPNPAAYPSFLKKVVNQANKIKPLSLCPGKSIPSCKSNGKTLPTGFIEKATFVMHPRALKQLAIDANHRTHSMSPWSGPFTP